MSGLSKLRELAQGMSKAERDYCINYLTAFDSRGKRHDNKTLKLFYLINATSNNDLTETDIVFQLYGSQKDHPNYIKLLLRLRDKLYEAITSEVNLNKCDTFTERAYYRIQLRKRLNQAEVLLHRNSIELADSLLIGLKEQAQVYELFEEQLAVLQLRHELALHKADYKEAQNLQAQINRCRLQSSTLETARKFYLHARHGDPDTIKAQFKELQALLEDAPSQTAQVYLLKAYSEAERNSKQYAAAAKGYRQIHSLYVHSKAVYDLHAQAETLTNLSEMYIRLQKFERAISTLEQAREAYTAAKRKPSALYHQLRFHAHLYAGQLAAIHEELDNYTPEQDRVKWSYYKAVACFTTGAYDQAILKLSRLSIQECLKADLGQWPKLLQIMAIITLSKQQDRFPQQRHLERLHSNLFSDEMSYREQRATDLLLALAAHHFSCKNALKTCQKEYSELQSTDPVKNWEVLSPELIPFDSWFSSQLFRSDLKKHLGYKRQQNSKQ